MSSESNADLIARLGSAADGEDFVAADGNDFDAIAARETSALLRESAAEIARLASSLKERDAMCDRAREALEPFANLAVGFEPTLICEGGTTITYPDYDAMILLSPDDFDPDQLGHAIEGVSFDEICVGAFRRASTVHAELAALEKQETKDG